MERHQTITITKKVAKHGSQAVLVIPRALEDKLRPGTLAQVTFEIIEKEEIGNE